MDPISIMNADDMEMLIRQANIKLPSPYRTGPLEYQQKLVEVGDIFSCIYLFHFFVCFFLFGFLFRFVTLDDYDFDIHHSNARLTLWFCLLLTLQRHCRQHYIEYLVKLINQHKIDPLKVYEGSELIAELRRMAMDIPERLENETDADFYGRCAQVIQQITTKLKKKKCTLAFLLFLLGIYYSAF